MAGLAAARMSGGSEFHAAGPACEKARSSNLFRSRGITYLLQEADRRPVRVAALLDVRMMSLRYAGHLPVCIPYMIVHLTIRFSINVYNNYDNDDDDYDDDDNNDGFSKV